jgi:hypothetical protein
MAGAELKRLARPHLIRSRHLAIVIVGVIGSFLGVAVAARLS